MKRKKVCANILALILVISLSIYIILGDIVIPTIFPINHQTIDINLLNIFIIFVIIMLIVLILILIYLQHTEDKEDEE